MTNFSGRGGMGGGGANFIQKAPYISRRIRNQNKNDEFRYHFRSKRKRSSNQIAADRKDLIPNFYFRNCVSKVLSAFEIRINKTPKA